MRNQTKTPSVMKHRKTRMSPTQFEQILCDNLQLAQLLEDYPEHPEQYIRSFMLRINGKLRKIITYQPDEFGNDLRKIHQLLAYAVRGIYTSSVNSFAYKENVGVLSALKKHLSSSVFLKTDIHAYFDSVDFDLMLNCLFQKRPFMQKQKTFWTKALAACFYEGHLPIGFISSPILSDLYLNDLDDRFSAIDGVQYTRYADDIIFSSDADDAEEKLREVQKNLTDYLADIHLEPNKKKTYIRTLKQEGDAIHLLGLNLVRTSKAKNRITVSDRYLRKTSMDLSDLIHEKDQIEEWERQERFCQIAGRISYIRHASSDSLKKLRKMIRIKTGIDTDLTNKSLSELCQADYTPTESPEPKPTGNIYPCQSIWAVPDNSRIREEVHIPAGSDRRIVSSLRYYLYHLCMEITSEIPDIQISKAELTIGEDTREIKDAIDVPSFRDHVLRLRKNREEIFYAAEYRYQTDTPLTSKRNRKTAVSERHMPICSMPRIPAHCFIYDEDSYSTWGPVRRTNIDLNNQQVVTHLINDMIPLQENWQGVFRMDLRWPRSTDEQRERQIQNICITMTKIPGINEEEIDFPRRHFVCASEKQLTAQSLQNLIRQLVELDKVICEANGRMKMDSKFKPAFPFDPVKLSDFWYLEMYCRSTGRKEITRLSFG